MRNLTFGQRDFIEAILLLNTLGGLGLAIWADPEMYNSVIWRHPQREEAPVVQHRQAPYTSLVNLGQRHQDQKSNRFATKIHGASYWFDMSAKTRLAFEKEKLRNLDFGFGGMVEWWWWPIQFQRQPIVQIPLSLFYLTLGLGLEIWTRAFQYCIGIS